MSDTTPTEYPTSHRFENDGDSIAGAVVRYSEGPGKFGPVPIMVLDTDMGERSIWLFSSILREKVGKAKPLPGERVVVTYLGQRTSQATGNTYKAWGVDVSDRTPSAPPFDDWAGGASTYHDDELPSDGGSGSPWLG